MAVCKVARCCPAEDGFNVVVEDGVCPEGSSGNGDCCSAGEGSPEGVVTGNPGKTYLDTLSGGFWCKLSGTGNVGWLQLIS